MKLREAGTLIIVAFVALCAISGIASRYICGPDSAVEEFCEDLIEQETGYSVDLSPSSLEVPR